MFHQETNQLKLLLERTHISEKFNGRPVAICGGAITSIISNKPVNDLDLFLLDSGEIHRVSDTLINLKYKCIHQTVNAMTYEREDSPIKIQIVTKDRYKDKSTVKSIIDLFDFTICMGGFDFRTQDFIFGNRFLLDLTKRQLVFNAFASNPSGSLIRMKKFLERGYSISNLELLKLAIAISRSPLTEETVAGQAGLTAQGVALVKDALVFNLEKSKEILNSEDFYEKCFNLTEDIY